MNQLKLSDIAQSSANKLTNIFGDGLIAEVKGELENPQYASPDESNEVDWVSIASLIVAVAAFAVQIHDSFFVDNHRYPSNQELSIKVHKEILDKTIDCPLPSKLSEHLETVINTTIGEVISQQEDISSNK